MDNPKNLLELDLTDLLQRDKNDPNKFFQDKKGNYRVKRPDNISDQMVFKGWALDPAGTKLIWENPKETMPTHPVHLYAKWGEPDYQWEVTFDPDGGDLINIKEEDLTTSRKTIQVGDIGQEEIKTFAKKEANQDDKQIFTVIQRQKLKEPPKPTKKGYDFMGWEVIRYKRDPSTGNYTNVIDDSYRKDYKVPELYSFGNDVVSPIYLKAIWVPNNRVNIDVSHYFLNKNYELDTSVNPNPKKDILEGKRANYLVATTGDKQDNEWILAPHADLEKNLTGDLKTEYDEYNKRVKADNTYFQQFSVEPAKKLNPATNKVEDNPDVQNNVFKFFYRPFRQREYKVNYIDERFRGKTNEKDGAIIDQELVINGNRHYDARNYRPIPGWKLVSDPQQQLFFDVDEDTNEFLGINGTSKDEITFYYKDVRVIEVSNKNDPVPDGYVRVTFKADNGGSFGKDAQGNDIKELHYDVIEGLQSQLLPVPEELEEGKQKEEGKYYITPDTGKNFIKWDKLPLLNEDTIIKKAYTFIAYFEWSGLSAPGLVRTEAFKDSNNTWTNDFAPKIEDLKKQLVWMEKGKKKDLPTGAVIKLYDEAGNELTTNDQVYDLVNEKKAADKEQLVRTVNIKAKVTFKTGQDPQELTIPITVYKNVYEALTTGEKPLFLSEAERTPAIKGGLQEILSDATTKAYVRVTVAPTGDMNSKDNKVYYVNPKAWVEIPEVNPYGSSTFINWTADQIKQNDDGKANGKFDFSKRHKFTENTIIKPVGSDDVVEQTDPNKEPDVPSSYVKVIVDKTENAKLGAGEKQTQTFWVNPTKEVTIGVTKPTGKAVPADPTKPGTAGYTMTFSKWETKDKAKTWTDEIREKFTAETTIVAKYSITSETIKPIVPTTDTVHTPQGKTPTADEIKAKITPPGGKTISKVTIVEDPDVTTPGAIKVKVIVEYTDGSSVGTRKNPVEVPLEVHKNIIPEAPGGQKPKDALDNYVKVIFKAGTGGTLSGDTVYYVSPDVEVDMTSQAQAVTKTPNVGYTSNGGTWSPEIKAEKITNEKTYEFNFVKSVDIVEEINVPNQVTTEGYVKVTFKTEDENKGKLEGNVKEKIYYVNPTAGITLKVLTGNETPTDKQLAVPKTIPAANYKFDKWQEAIDETTSITSERVLVAIFVAGDVKYVITDVGVQPSKDKYLEKITPLAGKEIKDIEVIKEPDVSKRGKSVAEISVNYTDGKSEIVEINVIVQDEYTPPTPNPNYPNEHHTHTCSGGRYETIVKEKIVKVPVPIVDNSYVKEVRFMQGFRGDFRPKDGLTRAEAAQILANALVEDGYKYNKDFKLPYKDIGEAWYTRAVKIVTQARVFAGYDDSNFRPQDKITRNEWIATLKRFQELKDASGNHMNLKDGHWAMGEIEAAYKEGWLKIYTDGLATYEGDEFIPREEVAAVSNKAFNRVLDKTYIENNYKNLIGYKDVKNDMWSYYDILCASNTYLYKKNFYRANWIKEDNNEFNINTDEFEIVKAKFQRNPR